MRDVLERRFGLKGKQARATLESVGGIYHITRERVRQIEADALRRLREGGSGEAEPLFLALEDELHAHGGVMAEHHLFSRITPPRLRPFVRFLLYTHPRIRFSAETDAYHPRWAVSREHADGAQHAIARVETALRERGRPIPAEEARLLVRAEFHATGHDGLGDFSDEACDAHLGISKAILSNPYGQYGLVSWPTVSPRGIRDKAYSALLYAGQPLHFRAVAEQIDRAGWPGGKKAHAQTVHNELIKDKRFILVGRGLYALQEWGYEPGTVGDVVASLLSRSSLPLARDEIVRLTQEKRMVKPQTILLNLQDRRRFKTTDDGKYTLV